jgi:hypothetical protein
MYKDMIAHSVEYKTDPALYGERSQWSPQIPQMKNIFPYLTCLPNLCINILLHQKMLFERKFVRLFNIFLFFNGSAAILPSSESSY